MAAPKTASKAAPKTKTAASKKAASQSHRNKSNGSFDFFGMEAAMTNTPFQFDNKFTQDAAALGQANMEAAIKSSTLFFKGMEDIMKTCMEFAQEGGEKSSEAAKSMMSCKTLNEFTDAQNKFAQSSFDDFMSGATKISEMSVKLCTEALEPINDQLNKSIKKATAA